MKLISLVMLRSKKSTKAEGRRQKAGGRRQEAEGRRQKGNLSHKGKRYETDVSFLVLRISQRMFLIFCPQGARFVPFSAFCPLPSAFLLINKSKSR